MTPFEVQDITVEDDLWAALPVEERSANGVEPIPNGVPHREDLLEEALRLAGLGYHVVAVYPIRGGKCSCQKSECPKPGKHPIGGDKRASTEPRQLRGQWKDWPDANIGINLGLSGVVDISSDNFEALADFRAKGLPDTACWQSGSGPGHEHHLFQAPDGCPQFRIPESDVRDIMSGGIAVAALSVSGDGPYLPLNPLTVPPSELPLAPIWAVEELRRKKERTTSKIPTTDPHEPLVRLDAEDERRWRGELVEHKRDGSVDRSESLLRLAYPLAFARMTRRGIVEALRDRDVALGWHKYTDRSDDRGYEEKADQAVALYEDWQVLSERMQRGEPLFGPRGEGASRKAGATDFLLIDFAESLDLPVAPKLIEGFLPQRSLSLCSAKRGSYKSAALNGISASIVSGLPWMLREIVKRGPVVQILAEGHGDLSKRNMALARHLGLDPEELQGLSYILATPNLTNPEHIKRLLDAIHKKGVDPVLVGIETLARTFGGGNENQQQDMNRYVDGLYEFYYQLPQSAVWVSHHFNKDDESRGSTVLLDAMDFAFDMRLGESSIVEFECTKNRYGIFFEPFYAKPKSILLDESGGSIRVGDKAIQIPDDENSSFVLAPCDPPTKEGKTIGVSTSLGKKLTEASVKLLRALDEAPNEELSWSRWYVVAGVGEKTMARQLQERLGGLVEHRTVGTASYYKLSDEGREVLKQCQ